MNEYDRDDASVVTVFAGAASTGVGDSAGDGAATPISHTQCRLVVQWLRELDGEWHANDDIDQAGFAVSPSSILIRLRHE